MNVMQNSSVVAVSALQDAGSRNGLARNNNYSLLKTSSPALGTPNILFKKKVEFKIISPPKTKMNLYYYTYVKC